MKTMTPAERIASVDYEIRERVIHENRAGRGMKNLATDYGISESTIRAIIHDSKLDPRPRTPPPLPTDLWNRPDLWHLHSLNRPTELRMVPVASSHRRS